MSHQPDRGNVGIARRCVRWFVPAVAATTAVVCAIWTFVPGGPKGDEASYTLWAAIAAALAALVQGSIQVLLKRTDRGVLMIGGSLALLTWDIGVAIAWMALAGG